MLELLVFSRWKTVNGRGSRILQPAIPITISIYNPLDRVEVNFLTCQEDHRHATLDHRDSTRSMEFS